MTSQFKYGLFLSHSWTNKEFVKTFKAKVEAKGVKCWIDDERMAAGDYLYDEIRIGVEESQVFAAFVSEPYVQSDNCNKEFSLAVDWKRPILPIRLIDGQWPPQGKVALGLAGKLYLDVRNGIIDDNALEELLKRAGLLPTNTNTGVVDSTDTKKHEDDAESVRKNEAKVVNASARTCLEEEAAAVKRRVEEKEIIPDVLPMDPVILVRFLKTNKVQNDVNEAIRIVGMLRSIALSSSGKQICINSGAPSALTDLFRERAVRDNWKAIRDIAATLDSISLCTAGMKACIIANTPFVLTSLAGEKAVKENGEAAKWIAGALWNIAMDDRGRQSCIKAGAVSALKSLSSERAVKDDDDASLWVRGARESVTHNPREYNQHLRNYKLKQSS